MEDIRTVKPNSTAKGYHGTFKKSMLYSLWGLLVVFIVAMVLFSVIFAGMLFSQKADSKRSEAMARLISLGDTISGQMLALEQANYAAQMLYEENIETKGAVLEEDFPVFYYDQTEGRYRTGSKKIPADILLKTKEYIAQNKSGELPAVLLQMDPNLRYAYSIGAAKSKNGELQYILVLNEDLAAIRQGFANKLFDGAGYYLQQDQGTVIFSSGMDEAEIAQWPYQFQQAAFEHKQAAQEKVLIQSGDWLLGELVLQTPGVFFRFKIPAGNVFLKNTGEIALVLLLDGIAACVAVFFFLHFKRRIYTPIKKIEQVVNGFSEGETQFELSIPKDNEFYEFSNHINDIIHHVHDLLDREYNESLMRKQAEINALQSQINPHFLYNTFDSMRGQAQAQGATNVAAMLKTLSNLFRYTISNSLSIVTLKDELENTDNYLAIQQYRFNNKFHIIKNIDESLLLYQIPKLTLQPIVENSLIHGLEPKRGQGTLVLRTLQTQNCLMIEVEDDGIGIPLQSLHSLNQKLSGEGIEENKARRDSTSIGLVNTNDRIQLLYGKQYGIKVYSTQGLGTTVQVILPILPVQKECSI